MINESVNSGLPPKAPASESKPVPSAVPLSSTAAARPGPLEAVPKEASAVDSTQLGAAVKKLNDYVQSIRRTLSFTVEESTGRTVISVYDAETDELIRQIPPEDTVKLAEQLQDQQSSLLIQERA